MAEFTCFFLVQFENFASEAIAVSQENVRNVFATIEAFAVSMGTVARASGSTWPNVTIEDYGAQADRVRNITKAAHVAVGVYVEDGPAFEEYAKDHLYDHLQQSLDFQGSDVNLKDLPIREDISWVNASTAERFHEDRPGPYVVLWHRHPFLTDPKKIFNMNNQLRNPTIASAFFQSAQTRHATLAYTNIVHGIRSQVIQPIFEDIEGKGRIVGMVWLVMEWGNYFQNLLPPETSNGIILVMSSNCGFDVTYQINGLEAAFLGFEDLHDPKYDEMGVHEDYFRLNQDASVELSDDICVDELTLHLYPSDVLREGYKTGNSIWYTCAVLVVFCVTSLVFLMYDFAVRRRQRIVMERIRRQDKIVSNLFPSKYRDRLYNSIGDGRRSTESTGSERSETDIQSRTRRNLDLQDFEMDHLLESAPLADLYLSTTVMFAGMYQFYTLAALCIWAHYRLVKFGS